MKRFGFAAALLLTTAMPTTGITPARATTSAQCAGLIAGISLCMEWWMKVSEHQALAARALKGDNHAANELAIFHDIIGQAAESRKWRLLAAHRGDCDALRFLHDDARSSGKGATAARWRAQLKRRHCPKPEYG